MEKRAVFAILLSALILFVWSAVVQRSLPPPPELPPETAPLAAGESAPGPRLAEPPDPAEHVEPAEGPAIAAAAEQRVDVSNGPAQVVLTNRGAAAAEWAVTRHTDVEGRPLVLFPAFVEESAPRPLEFTLPGYPELAETLARALYEVEREKLDGGERVRFTWSDGRGLSAVKTFTFRTGSWFVEVDGEVVDRGRRLPVGLAIGPGFGGDGGAGGGGTYYYKGQGAWNVGGTVTRLKPKKVVASEGSVSGDLRWAALEDQYFAAVVIPHADEAQARWRGVELTPPPLPGAEGPAEKSRQPILEVTLPRDGATLYVGPKDYRLLAAIGPEVGIPDVELERVVWFATNPFLAWITKYLFFGLVWLHDHVYASWGLAIILATVLLRLVLFPVNQYSMVKMRKSQAQMQKLQPKVKAIKARYAKKKDAQNRAKMNQEMMELYKREGVNPAGGIAGCLPMLAQFPILISFYFMLTVAIELRGERFLWLPDLTQKDPFLVAPILMAITMFAQQKLAMTKVTDPVQAQQQKIMLLMPVVFGFICLNLPSGMVLYWFVNNLLGIAQQWLVNRHAASLEAAAQKA